MARSVVYAMGAKEPWRARGVWCELAPVRPCAMLQPCHWHCQVIAETSWRLLVVLDRRSNVDLTTQYTGSDARCALRCGVVTNAVMCTCNYVAPGLQSVVNTVVSTVV